MRGILTTYFSKPRESLLPYRQPRDLPADEIGDFKAHVSFEAGGKDDAVVGSRFDRASSVEHDASLRRRLHRRSERGSHCAGFVDRKN